MQPPVQLLVSLGLACCVALLGRYVARAPEKIYRVFTFGLMPPVQFFVGFIRFVGWFWFASTGFYYLLLDCALGAVVILGVDVHLGADTVVTPRTVFTLWGWSITCMLVGVQAVLSTLLVRWRKAPS